MTKLSTFKNSVNGGAAILGGGWFYTQTYGFDFDNASLDARRAYLERQAEFQKGTFKPNYLAKFTRARASSRSLTFTYNTGMGSATCGQGVDCLEKACFRYGMTSLARNEISVRVIYTDNTGRQIDGISVSPRVCQRLKGSRSVQASLDPTSAITALAVMPKWA